MQYFIHQILAVGNYTVVCFNYPLEKGYLQSHHFTDAMSLARSAARVPAIMISRFSTSGADISFNIDRGAADKFKPDQNLPTHSAAT